jgi:hypothetical protein
VKKYNLLINSCGSISPTINQRKEIGLLFHNTVYENAVHIYYPEGKHQPLTLESTNFLNMIKR